MIINKNGSPCQPLTIQFSPYSLEPARVSNGQVKTVFIEVMPVAGSDDVSQGINAIKDHHFWITSSTGSEAYNKRVTILSGCARAFKRHCFFYTLLKVIPVFRNIRTNGNKFFNRW